MTKEPSKFAIYLITFILAACSLLYELLLAQSMSTLVQSTEIWYTVTIGFYLVAMGFGAMLYPKICRHPNKWQSLFHVEIMLTLIGGLSVMLVHFDFILLRFLPMVSAPVNENIVFIVFFLMIVMMIGFLTGLELPLLLDLGRLTDKNNEHVAYRVLAADYFGSLIGGFIFPLILLRYLDVLIIGFLTAGVNLIVAYFILWRYREAFSALALKTTFCCILSIALIYGVMRFSSLQQYFLKKNYYYTFTYYNYLSTKSLFSLIAPLHELPDIERHHSPYQSIDIVKIKLTGSEVTPYLMKAYSSKHINDPDYPAQQALLLNGAYQFGSDVEEIYHEYFAHIPIMLNEKRPKNVLVLGAGDGLLIRELLKYPDITSITHVELDPIVVKLVNEHPILNYMTKGTFNDPRITRIISDAFHFIRTTKNKYDAIYMDFPDPKNFNLSKLYSQEFYHFAKQRLNKNGFIVFDAPKSRYDNTTQTPKSDAYALIYLSTLKAAGFQTIIPYVSTLEDDNPKAFTVLEDHMKTISKAWLKNFGLLENYPEIELPRQAMMEQQMIDSFIHMHQSAFVWAKAEKDDLVFSYTHPDIELYVLNEERFQLAFPSSTNFENLTHSSYVNSIMRPTLPYAKNTWDKLLQFD